MKCPKCRLTNHPSAQRCDCGYDFVSGTLEESYLHTPLPALVTGWSWPGFLGNWVFGLAHGHLPSLVGLGASGIGVCLGRSAIDQPLILLMRLGLSTVSLGLSLYLGLHGNEIAWRSRKWPSPEAFLQSQRRWTMALAGVAAFVAFLSLLSLGSSRLP